MAYFIVIGTNDKVKNVVDEIEKSHLQHNVVSSGCITSKENGEGLTYKWTPVGEDNVTEKSDSRPLQDLLANHIANFKTVLPAHESPKVMIVSNCMDEADEDRLEWMFEDLLKTPGGTFAAVQIDIILIAYDFKEKSDVTIRPQWPVLKKVKTMLDRNNLCANLLYINNVDYFGAATNLDDKLLGRFLGHWGAMSNSEVRGTINTTVYSIGMAEYQYNFEDLVEYFKLNTEERIIDRKLNAHPSTATQELIDKKECLEIDLPLPWLDGIRSIKDLWSSYFETKYDFSKPIAEQPYCLQQQIKHIVQYLNGFLKIYVKQKEEELAEAKNALAGLESERKSAEYEVANVKDEIKILEGELPDELKSKLQDIEKHLEGVTRKKEEKQREINAIEHEIKDKTYLDANDITELYNPDTIVTDAEQEALNDAKNQLAELENYLKTDDAVRLIKEIAQNAAPLYPYPKSAIENIGRLEQRKNISIPLSQPTPSVTPVLEERNGCTPWAWLVGLFKGRNNDNAEDINSSASDDSVTGHVDPVSVCSPQEIAKAVKALKTNVENVRAWWNKTNSLIRENSERQNFILNGLENYNEVIPNHRKSRTLIELQKVNDFRRKDLEHSRWVKTVLDIWFDATIGLDKRVAQKDLIDTHVIVPLRDKYNILRWDETNPFVNEIIDENRAHEIIEHTYAQSKPFVQYVNIDTRAIINKISDSFYFNHPNVFTDPIDFRNTYRLSSGTISPHFDNDFENSLCAVQILGIEDYVNDIQDFKPKRETHISPAPADSNFNWERLNIIGNAQDPKEIARRIYDWLCDNIQYDTTKTIHDADTCWRSKKGVCQAYCELFCHIAGDRLITEVVTGKSKQTDGTIPESLHAWLYVYTDGYNGIFIDPTWGAGGINDGRFVQSVDRDVWFDVDPAWMIFTHYPEKEEWQKLDIDDKLSDEQFAKLPAVSPDKSKNSSNELAYQLHLIATKTTEDE